MTVNSWHTSITDLSPWPQPYRFGVGQKQKDKAKLLADCMACSRPAKLTFYFRRVNISNDFQIDVLKSGAQTKLCRSARKSVRKKQEFIRLTSSFVFKLCIVG